MSNSRWANASREDLEALAEATANEINGVRSFAIRWALARLLASCPPLRTRAEVAEEALKLLKKKAKGEIDLDAFLINARALAKEPTR